MTFGERWRKELLREWLVEETRTKIYYFYLENYRDGFFKGYFVQLQKGFPKSINYNDLKFSDGIIGDVSVWSYFKKLTDADLRMKLTNLMTRAMLKANKEPHRDPRNSPIPGFDWSALLDR